MATTSEEASAKRQRVEQGGGSEGTLVLDPDVPPFIRTQLQFLDREEVRRIRQRKEEVPPNNVWFEWRAVFANYDMLKVFFTSFVMSHVSQLLISIRTATEDEPAMLGVRAFDTTGAVVLDGFFDCHIDAPAAMNDTLFEMDIKLLKNTLGIFTATDGPIALYMTQEHLIFQELVGDDTAEREKEGEQEGPKKKKKTKKKSAEAVSAMGRSRSRGCRSMLPRLLTGNAADTVSNSRNIGEKMKLIQEVCAHHVKTAELEEDLMKAAKLDSNRVKLSYESAVLPPTEETKADNSQLYACRVVITTDSDSGMLENALDGVYRVSSNGKKKLLRNFKLPRDVPWERKWEGLFMTDKLKTIVKDMPADRVRLAFCMNPPSLRLKMEEEPILLNAFVITKADDEDAEDIERE